MKLKKAAAVVSAFAVTAALCVPATALAADTDTATSETVASATAKESVITGTIAVTTLSVSVPTKAAFTIDPTITVTNDAAGTTAQLTNVPTNYSVTNNSAVPVYAYISKCEITKGAGMTGTPTLVTATSGLSTDNAVMFAVKDDAGKPANFDAADNWLTAAADLKYYPIKDNGKLAAQKMKDGAADPSQTDNKATMSFYGQTTTGWVDGDTFTVKPTFTIATQDPATPTA